MDCVKFVQYILKTKYTVKKKKNTVVSKKVKPNPN